MGQGQFFGKVAGNIMIVAQVTQGRLFDFAAFLSVAAARVEVTARGRVGRVGDLTLQADADARVPGFGVADG